MAPVDPVDPVDLKESIEPEDLPASEPDAEGARPEPSPMNRRRFVRVLAAGGAALLAGGAPSARAAAPKAAAPKPPKPLPPALQRELRTQEKSLADVLKVVREYDLPPGSEPATVFRAMRARRGMR